MPKEHVLETAARVPGTDGEKMSKSYNNTLAVFEDAKVQRKQIMRIVTDSATDGINQKNRPAMCSTIYSSTSRPKPTAKRWSLSTAAQFRLRRSKKSTGRTRPKNTSPNHATAVLNLAAKPEHVREVLAAGAAKARKKAAEVLKRAQDACGIRS